MFSRLSEFPELPLSTEQRRLCAGILVGTTLVLAGTHAAYKLKKRHARDAKIKKKQSDVAKEKAIIEQNFSQRSTSWLAEAKAITQLTLAQLRSKIDSGELKIVDVVDAYQWKALQVDHTTNSISEIVSSAHAFAEELDSAPSAQKKGPLYGIPISIKDMLCLENYDNTYGLSSRIGQPASSDCVVVAALRKQGAIPIALTNMAQMGLAVASSNPIFGETVNAIDPKRTGGGSSGGEGSLVGGGGTLLGFGTDLGGSVRFPAAYNGIYSLRPTSQRVSWAGIDYPCPGAGSIAWVVGPMARDVESLAMAMKVLLNDNMFSLDPNTVPLAFDDKVYQPSEKKKLRIGFYTTLDTLYTYETVPAVKRAVLEAKKKLESLGHEVIEFTPPDMGKAFWELAVGAVLNDGGKTIAQAFASEPLDPCVNRWITLMNTRRWVKSLLSFALSVSSEFRFLKYFVDSVKGSATVDDTWALITAQHIYKAQYHSCWAKAGIDAILCPATPYPAPPLGHTRLLFPASVAYTMVYNLIDCPAGIVPVTKVTEADVKGLGTPANKYPTFDRDHRLICEDQKTSVGMPICVQIVTLRWQEELCLRVMKELEDSLKSS